MNSFSQRSLKNLETVNYRLVVLMTYALATTKVDFVVIEGLRSYERQLELYGIGRRYVGGKWVNQKGERRVTWTLDSKHCEGLAVDLYPFPIPRNLSCAGQEYLQKQLYLRKHIKKCAKILNIPLRIISKDLPHYEL